MTEIWSISHYLGSGTSWLLLIALRTTLVLGSILMLGSLLRKRSPHEQRVAYRVGLVATGLVVVLSLPGFQLFPTVWSIPYPGTRELRGEAAGSVANGGNPSRLRTGRSSSGGGKFTRFSSADNQPTSSSAGVVEAGSRSTVDREARRSFEGSALSAGLLALWLGGAILLLVRLLLGLGATTRLCRSCRTWAGAELRELTSELCRRSGQPSPELLQGEGVTSPMVVGILQPAILLPESFLDDFTPTQRRAVLAHEIGHLAGRDLVWSFACRLLTSLLWFQPLLWILVNRLEQANEEVSDAAALDAGCSRQEYARLLVSLAERMVAATGGTRILGIPVVPLRSSVGRRIGRLFAAPPPSVQDLPRTQRLGIGIAVLAAAGVSAAIGYAADPPPSLSLEQARLEAKLRLKAPQGLPDGVKLDSIRVYPIRATPLRKDADPPAEPFYGYGMTLRPERRRVWIRAMERSVAARHGIPGHEVELLKVDGKLIRGPFPIARKAPVELKRETQSPKANGEELYSKPSPVGIRASDADAKRLTDLVMAVRKEPVTLTFRRGSGKVQTVRLTQRERLTFTASVSGFFPDKTATFIYSRSGKTFRLFQIPPTTRHHMVKALRPLTVVEHAAQLVPFKSARRTYVEKLEVWTLGPEDAPSAFWSAGGIDFWLENPEGVLSRDEVTEIVRANSVSQTTGRR